jgi:hypothetical protein
MERTVRPIQREVPVMHSAGQDAERLGLRHTVGLLDQIGQLVHCLECRGRDFLVHTDRTSAEALILVVGMGLVDDLFHHHRESQELDSSKDHEVKTGADHQQEYGWAYLQRPASRVVVG